MLNFYNPTSLARELQSLETWSTEIPRHLCLYSNLLNKRYQVPFINQEVSLEDIISKAASIILLYLKGFAHVREKRKVWSKKTVSDAISGDLPRLQNMGMRGTRVERQATLPLQSREVPIFCRLSLAR